MSNLSPQVHAALEALLPNRISTQRDLLDQHGQDESFHAPCSPDVVVYPVTNEEVSQIVQLCAQTRTPLIPFGSRHIPRRSYRSHTGWHLYGHVTNGPDSRDKFRRSGLPGPSWGDAQTVECRATPSRSIFSPLTQAPMQPLAAWHPLERQVLTRYVTAP